MPDPRLEVRERNRRAVQRLFAQKQQQQRSAVASTVTTNAADLYATSTPMAAPSSIRPSSSITLSTYHALATAVRDDGANPSSLGTASYAGPQHQPAWVQVSARGCVLQPSLDVASHLSQQLQLSAELSGGKLSRDEYNALLAQVAVTRGSKESAADSLMDPKRSCFALHLAKHQHRVEIGEAERARVSDAHALNRRETEQLHSALYHHQQAILRNERALARKRAAAAYTSLTAAQADAAFAFPNAHTLDRLTSEKYAGGRWLLDNPHRQQLRGGEPLMTQVMRGDFYESHTGRPREGVTSQPRSRSAAGRTVNAQQWNKRDVRVASAINASQRRSQSCQQRVKGGCFCAAPATVEA